MQLRVVEFKKWRIDFKKQDAHTFIFYFQNIEMPVAIFASFRVSLIYVVGEFQILMLQNWVPCLVWNLSGEYYFFLFLITISLISLSFPFLFFLFFLKKDFSSSFKCLCCVVVSHSESLPCFFLSMFYWSCWVYRYDCKKLIYVNQTSESKLDYPWREQTWLPIVSP